jgi:hypothetical protein
MDEWTARFGPQGGTVIVYSVPDEDALLDALESVGQGSRTVLWREPDLHDQATAFATDKGRLELPLLGRQQRQQEIRGRSELQLSEGRSDRSVVLVGPTGTGSFPGVRRTGERVLLDRPL